MVVLRLAAMGDVLRTLPAVRLLRSGLPEARIHWLVDDRWAAVLEGVEELDGVVRFPRKAWGALPSGPRGFGARLRSLRELRAELGRLRGDLLLDFHGNLRSGVLGRLSGVPVRLGYSGPQAKEGNRVLTTHHVPARERRTPRMERNLDLIRALGLPDGPLRVGDLPLARRGREAATHIAGDGPIAVVSPGASAAQAYKKPPASTLAAAARACTAAGLTPWIVWGPGEEPDARAVVDLEGDARLAPPTDLPTLAALLERATVYVGGDSGPLHLACAVGCPVVGVYGPTDPRINRPWGVPYRVVAPPGRTYSGLKREDRRAGRFEGLADETVAGAVTELCGEISGRS